MGGRRQVKQQDLGTPWIHWGLTVPGWPPAPRPRSRSMDSGPPGWSSERPPLPAASGLVSSAGNTMTVSYMTGLTLGSAVAYCTYSLTRDTGSSCLHAPANFSFPPGL